MPVNRGVAPESTDGLPVGLNLTYGLLDILGRAIVTGRYESVKFPIEAEIAKQHCLSRSTVRESVKMLTTKGLLSARPRQGTKVQPPSRWNLFDTDVLRWLLERQFSVELLKQFNQLRVSIEPEAAALAASFGDDAAVARITAGVRRMEEAQNDLEELLAADIAFHIAILEASGNPFYAQFRDVVNTALRTSIRFTDGMKARIANVADHKRIHDAIIARDPDLARSSMRALINDVLELIRKAEEHQDQDQGQGQGQGQGQDQDQHQDQDQDQDQGAGP